MPDAPTPEMLKKMRVGEESESVPSDRNGTAGKGKHRATVEDVSDDDVNMDASSFAPGGDADYFAEEDEEGRFYGGGLTQEQKDILNIFDQAAGEGAQEDVSMHL
jgi:beta-catenin-like protein 1